MNGRFGSFSEMKKNIVFFRNERIKQKKNDLKSFENLEKIIVLLLNEQIFQNFGKKTIVFNEQFY